MKNKVKLISFGMSLPGPVPKVDVLLDVRWMVQNPYHSLADKKLTGKDDGVRKQVVQSPGAEEVLRALDSLLAIPAIRTIGVACMGGRHRSVALIEETATRYAGPRGLELIHLALPARSGHALKGDRP